MQNGLHARAGRAAIRRMTDITFNKIKIPPVFFPYCTPNPGQIPLLAGREIIKPNHGLALPQQRFEQMCADKPGHPRNQPVLRGWFQSRNSCLLGETHDLNLPFHAPIRKRDGDE
jgi:hypothetical protein